LAAKKEINGFAFISFERTNGRNEVLLPLLGKEGRRFVLVKKFIKETLAFCTQRDMVDEWKKILMAGTSQRNRSMRAGEAGFVMYERLYGALSA